MQCSTYIVTPLVFHDELILVHLCSQLLIDVQVGGDNVQVQVREDAPVITVIFRTADRAGLAVSVHSALFEVSDHLKMGKCMTQHYIPTYIPFSECNEY